MAGEYREAFEALIRGEREHPLLLRIAIDDRIQSLEEEAFWRTLRAQMESYYRRRLQLLTRDTRLPYAQKSYWIRKIKTDILPRLKKGELVPYASDFTL